MNPGTSFTTARFETELKRSVALDYLLHRPNAAEALPLVLFLHGSGERGEDLTRVKAHGLPKLMGRATPFPEPAIVLAPQCPADSWWTLELDALEGLLDHALARLAVDTSRVYLTGLSMGGYGAWYLALKRPERFAALVPVCGGGLIPVAARLAGLPVWAFHGADDPVFPPSESECMVEAVQQAGGRARLTVYEGVGHNSWDRAYAESELWDWMFTQRRGQAGT